MSKLTHSEIQDLINSKQPLPAGLTTTGNLDLWRYPFALPAGLTTTGNLHLGNYPFALPAAIMARVRADMFDVLDHAIGEAKNLLFAIRNGEINDSAYTGKCACLVGTLEKSGHISIDHDSSRMAEQWFLNIQTGDTPASNRFSAQAEAWLVEWMQEHDDEVTA